MANRSTQLTGHLRKRLEKECSSFVEVITPADAQGCQLSLSLTTGSVDGKKVFDHLVQNGVTLDWREPNGIRVAPVPLYNTSQDVDAFVNLLVEAVKRL